MVYFQVYFRFNIFPTYHKNRKSEPITLSYIQTGKQNTTTTKMLKWKLKKILNE